MTNVLRPQWKIERNKAIFKLRKMQIDNNQLLRFTTAGSVDDGKSTLIGRLLYDSKSSLKINLKPSKQLVKRKDMKV